MSNTHDQDDDATVFAEGFGTGGQEPNELDETMQTVDANLGGSNDAHLAETLQTVDAQMLGGADANLAETLATVQASMIPADDDDAVATIAAQLNNAATSDQETLVTQLAVENATLAATVATQLQTDNPELAATIVTQVAQKHMPDLAETLATQSANMAETLATQPAALAETLATVQAGVAQDNDVTLISDPNAKTNATQLHFDTGTMGESIGGGTGLISQDGRVTMRTRPNGHLPGEVQTLDTNLQLARRSVFVDMAAQQGASRVPPVVKSRLTVQDTVGKYVVSKPLAAGGMGAVLAVEDHDFQRNTAMKVIHAKFAHDPAALERFLEEAQVTAQLEHPNIVPIHDLGVTGDGTLFYTMKMIQGQSFGDVVKKLKNEDPATVKVWNEEMVLISFLKVLDGVGYAHERGVVHRDIKPDNIMIENHGEVLVVDWGIAKVLPEANLETLNLQDGEVNVREMFGAVKSARDEEAASATMTGSIMGTPYYMPPEQARGDRHDIDGRSDIFALGATLYELLCLERPYGKKSLQELLMAIIDGKWIPLDQRKPELHQDLVAIVHKSMSTFMDRRYQSCTEMADDIRAYLAGQAVAARKRNIIEKVGAWIQRNKMKFLMAAAFIVVAVIGGFAALQAAEQAKAEEAASFVNQAEDTLSEDNALFAMNPDTNADGEVSIDEIATFETNRRNFLQEAMGYINSARGLVGDSDKALVLREEVSSRLGSIAAAQKGREAKAKLEQELKEREHQAELVKVAKQKALAQATKLLEDASKLVSNNNFDDAKSKVEALFQLDVDASDVAVKKVLTQAVAMRSEIGKMLADKEYAEKSALAEKEKIAGDTILLQAQQRFEKIPMASSQAVWDLQGNIDEWLNGIAETKMLVNGSRKRYTASQNTGISAVGIEEQIASAASIEARLEDMNVAVKGFANDTAESLKLTEHGKAALGKDFDPKTVADAKETAIKDAIVKFTRAQERMPYNKEARTFAQNAAQALAFIDKRRQERVQAAQRLKQAEQAFTKAEIAKREWERHSKLITEKADFIIREEKRLQHAPYNKKQDLYIAHDEMRTHRQQAAEQWADAEASAQQVLSFAPDSDANGIRESALNILATLHYAKLGQAILNEDVAAQAAHRKAVNRYDSKGVYRDQIAGNGSLTITGQFDGPVRIQRVERHFARLQPTENVETITKAMTKKSLPAGRYRIKDKHVQLDVVLEAGQEKSIILPGPSPRLILAGDYAIPLAYVPAADGGKGFWMSKKEIMHSEYYNFLYSPGVLARIKKAVQTMIDEERQVPFPYLPKNERQNITGWYEIKYTDDFEFKKIAIGDQIKRWPVTGITRSDAEAFCAWIGSKNAGLRARLPAVTEWQRAAQGGDRLRIYPWGDIFDPAFVSGAVTAGPTPANVGSAGADIGPFGHHDLAGSVREWAGDREGTAVSTHGGVVCGGGWTDANSNVFRSLYTEAVPPTAVNAAVGFRIVVEAE